MSLRSSPAGRMVKFAFTAFVRRPGVKHARVFGVRNLFRPRMEVPDLSLEVPLS